MHTEKRKSPKVSPIEKLALLSEKIDKELKTTESAATGDGIKEELLVEDIKIAENVKEKSAEVSPIKKVTLSPEEVNKVLKAREVTAVEEIRNSLPVEIIE